MGAAGGVVAAGELTEDLPTQKHLVTLRRRAPSAGCRVLQTYTWSQVGRGGKCEEGQVRSHNILL